MSTAANLCSLLRVALAPVFAWQLAVAEGAASVAPLVIYALAALSDFADGRLARAAGRVTRTGRLLDHGADAVFLFPGFAVLAAAGRVPALLPAAAVSAFGLYWAHGWQNGRVSGGVDLVASRVGAAAGVANYAIAGAAACALAVGRSPFDQGLYLAALAAALLNALAAFEQLRHLRWPRLGAAARARD